MYSCFMILLTWPPWIYSVPNIGGCYSLPRAEVRGALYTTPIGLRARLISSPSNLRLIFSGSYIHFIVPPSFLPSLPILTSISLWFLQPSILHHLHWCMPRYYPYDIQSGLLPPSTQEPHYWTPLRRQTPAHDRTSLNVLCDLVLTADNIHPDLI